MDHLVRKVHTCTIEIRAHFKSRTLTLRCSKRYFKIYIYALTYTCKRPASVALEK